MQPFLECRYYQSSDAFAMDLHFHPGMELFMMHEGEGHFFVRDRVYDYQPGSIFWIRARDMHKVCIKPGVRYVRSAVTFDERWLEMWLPSFPQAPSLLHVFQDISDPRIFMTDVDQKELIQLFSKLSHAQLQQKEESWSAPMEALMLITQMLLLVHRCRAAARPDRSVHFATGQPLLHALLTYMDENIGQTLGVSQLAEVFHLQKSYLCRWFKKEFGATLGSYILSRRIALAKHMLLTQRESLDGIANRIGLRDGAYLCRIFKQATGMTPMQYKKAFSTLLR